MGRYNMMRPLLLIAVALLTKSLVTNLCILLGMAQEPASNLGFIAMIIAAFVVYSRFAKQRRK